MASASRGVIIEDTLGMFKEFISSQTVRKNYYPPDNNIESDWMIFGVEDSIMSRWVLSVWPFLIVYLLLPGPLYMPWSPLKCVPWY